MGRGEGGCDRGEELGRVEAWMQVMRAWRWRGVGRWEAGRWEAGRESAAGGRNICPP